MTSQPGQQTFTHIAHISLSKDNHIMKLGQLIILREMCFFKHYAESKAGRLVPDPFLCF